jgi:hypothetical protein
VINLEDNHNTRPIGHKKAKNERYGNKKTPAALSAVSEKLDKFIEVTTMARKDREKQQNLANSKIKAARLNESIADKQLKCKMLDTYRELLVAPTTNLNANAPTSNLRKLNVPLAFCSFALVFCDDQHVSTSKGIFRVSCLLV